MILFDELGLAERAESNPLKVLHGKLEYTGKEEGISFVGISNYSLDAAKINRALVLSVPDLDQQIDELTQTAQDIAESISSQLKNESIFNVISLTYFEYKRILQVIKELVVYKQYVDNKKDKTHENIILNNPQDNKNEKIIEDTTNSQKTFEEQKQSNNDNEDELSKPKEREKKPFEFIKRSKDFKDLLKKENKIIKEFHVNLDFII